MSERRVPILRPRIVRPGAREKDSGKPPETVTEGVVRPEEKRLIRAILIGVSVALLFPFPPVKYTLMIILGGFMLSVFFKDLRLALCLLPIILPAQTLSGGALTLAPGINFETLFIGMLLVAWSSQRSTFRPLRPSNPMPAFVGVVIAFLVWVAASMIPTLAIGSPPLGELLQVYKNQWIYVVLLFVFADSLRTERDRQRAMVAICLAMILVAIQPMYQAADDLAHGLSLLRHRAVSLISLQPNIYGGALACFLSFPLMYFSRKLGGKRGRLFFGTAAGVAAYTLVLTLSRGSWLAIGAASFFIGLLFERRVLLILVLVAVSAPFWAPEEAIERADTMSGLDVSDPNLRSEEGSGWVRVDQWKMIPRVLAAAPILGHGFQRFPEVYFRYGTYQARKGAHVAYAEYAAEAGVLGLLLYVGVFLSLGAFGLRLAWSGTSAFARAHGIGLMGAAVAMMVAEGFGSRFKAGTVTAFLWMYAGVAIAAWRWPDSSVEDPELKEKERRGLIRRPLTARARAPIPGGSVAPAQE